MKKIIVSLIMVFALVSCGSEAGNDNTISTWGIVDVWTGSIDDNYINIEDALNEAQEAKWVIDDTIEVLEWYEDTLKNVINDAKDIKDTINDRYWDL